MQCRNCGADNPDNARFCGLCGRPVLASQPPTEPAQAPSVTALQRQRPLWLVAVLSLVTAGVYTPIWMGLTWAEMKSEIPDDRMQPVWHGLTVFVPVYSYFRIHAHYRTINELLARAGAAETVNPGGAVLGFLVGNVGVVIGRSASGGLLTAILLVTALAIVATSTVQGQAGLNAYWRAAANRKKAIE